MLVYSFGFSNETIMMEYCFLKADFCLLEHILTLVKLNIMVQKNSENQNY